MFSHNNLFLPKIIAILLFQMQKQMILIKTNTTKIQFEVELYNGKYLRIYMFSKLRSTEKILFSKHSTSAC